jgi:hypothetical protein
MYYIVRLNAHSDNVALIKSVDNYNDFKGLG